jgi:acyl-CoA synthetase (AMP-forming)/AMP-acid ligase II/acyl carrier protein
MRSSAEALQFAEPATVSSPVVHDAGLGRVIAQRLSQEPDREILVFVHEASQPRSVHAAELHLTATRCAEWLQTLGLQRGELIILLLPPGIELAAAFVGALYAGLVPAVLPQPSRQSATERLTTLSTSIAESGAHAVIVSIALQEQLSTLLHSCRCAVAGLDITALPQSTGNFTPIAASANAPAYLQFSSGTTGLPKGAIISHRAIINQLHALVTALQVNRDDTTVGWLPLFHDMGLITQLLLPVAHGGKAVLLAPDHWLRRPSRLFQSVHDHGGTMIFMPNFGYEHCLRHVASEDLAGIDLGTLKVVSNGAEPVHFDTMRRFVERYSRHGLKSGAMTVGYGLAENVLGASCTPFGAEPRVEWLLEHDLQAGGTLHPVAPGSVGSRAILSCGTPLSGTAIRVVDADGKSLADHIQGEIEITGNCLFSGYWRRPEWSAQALHEGWLRTGDVGYLVDRELFVCGRKKDVIIVGGRNIHPAAIEKQVIDAGEGRFKRAVAFGVADIPGTESAVVVLETFERVIDTDLQSVLEGVRRAVTGALDIPLADVLIVPRGWIKMTTSGKLARAATREKYLATHSRSDNNPGESVSDWIIALIRQHAGASGEQVGGIQASDNILALGIDSLVFLQLILRVEAQYQCTIPLDALVDEPTIGNLAQLVENSRTGIEPRNAVAAVATASCTKARPSLRLLQSRSDWISYGPPLIQSYSFGNKLLRNATGVHAVRERLMRGCARDALHALSEISGSPCPEALLRHNLFSNCWRIWRRRMLAANGNKWITVQGVDAVQANLAAGRGVVLAAASVTTHFALEQVVRDLSVPVTVIGVGRAPAVTAVELGSADYDPRANATRRESMLAHQLVLAQRVLGQGGVVLVAGDGHEGRHRITCPFLGREQEFSQGFAEIALLTDAVVVPVWISLAWDGQVIISFAEHIDPVAAGTREAIVSTYAQWLAERWRSDPANLPWRALREFLKLPLHRQQTIEGAGLRGDRQ